MVKEIGNAHKALFNQFSQPNDRSYGVMKMLFDVYPAFQKKLLDGNIIMQKLVMTGYSPMDILDYPICGKCETLAVPNEWGIKDGRKVPRCSCLKESCGANTLNPISLRQWIKYELKKRADDDFIEAIDVAIDYIAASMIKKHQNELKDIMTEKRAKDKKKLGILLPDGTEYQPPEVSIEHCREQPDLPNDIQHIPDNEGEN